MEEVEEEFEKTDELQLDTDEEAILIYYDKKEIELNHKRLAIHGL